MPNINSQVIAHQLNIDPKYRLIKHKRRAFKLKCYEAIKAEVNMLLKADFISNIDYPTWLSNIILVRKTNKQWRIFVDFTVLNETCPKDYFPLP